MHLSVFTITVESTSPDEFSQFCLQLLDYSIEPNFTSSVQIGDPTGAGPSLLFAPTKREKAGKNRIHLDLRPDDQPAAAERAIDPGARHISVGQSADASWVVLADPEGNEFCILQSQQDFDA
jgi:hypothetical protein